MQASTIAIVIGGDSILDPQQTWALLAVIEVVPLQQIGEKGAKKKQEHTTGKHGCGRFKHAYSAESKDAQALAKNRVAVNVCK